MIASKKRLLIVSAVIAAAASAVIAITLALPDKKNELFVPSVDSIRAIFISGDDDTESMIPIDRADYRIVTGMMYSALPSDGPVNFDGDFLKVDVFSSEKSIRMYIFKTEKCEAVNATDFGIFIIQSGYYDKIYELYKGK